MRKANIKPNKTIEGPPEWSYQVVRDAKIDILVIGEDPCFGYDIPFRREEKVKGESLVTREGFASLAIVIIDRNNRLKLSVEEIDQIDKCIYDRKIPVVYIGHQYGDAWEHEGEGGSYGMVAGNQGIAYTYEKGVLIKSVNFWSMEHEEIFKTQPEELGYAIIRLLEATIRNNS